MRPSFSILFSSQNLPVKPILLQEGIYSITAYLNIYTSFYNVFCIIISHLRMDEASSTIPVVGPKTQRSNIVAVSVSPRRTHGCVSYE